VEAIELTSFYEPRGQEPRGMIFDKEKLLSVYDQTKDTERCRPSAERWRGRECRMIEPRTILSLATILGFLGLWLLLPRGSPGDGLRRRVRPGRAGGMGLAGARLGDRLPTASFCWWPRGPSSPPPPRRVPQPRLLGISFGMTLAGTAGLFLLAGAEFLAVATLSSTRAILVTFLFVLMLSQPEGHTPTTAGAGGDAHGGHRAFLIGVLSMTIADALTSPKLTAAQNSLSLRESGTGQRTPSPPGEAPTSGYRG